MAKPGRNDPCPCGSGNKYKKCCLAKDEAAFGAARFRKNARGSDRGRGSARLARHPASPGIHELKTAIAARRGMSEENLQRYEELMDASDAIVDLVRSAKLDAAEVAARDLLARFPDQPDGWDRLGMVYEARGENQKAAESYRKVIEFIRQHPDAYRPGFEDPFVKLVDRLDPPARPDRPGTARATPGRLPCHHLRP